jgi:hypothetical protein
MVARFGVIRSALYQAAGYVVAITALAVPAQNFISGEIRGLRRVRGDEMHELSRTPAISDRAGQSEQLVFAIEIQHPMAWPAM